MRLFLELSDRYGVLGGYLTIVSGDLWITYSMIARGRSVTTQ